MEAVSREVDFSTLALGLALLKTSQRNCDLSFTDRLDSNTWQANNISIILLTWSANNDNTCNSLLTWIVFFLMVWKITTPADTTTTTIYNNNNLYFLNLFHLLWCFKQHGLFCTHTHRNLRGGTGCCVKAQFFQLKSQSLRLGARQCWANFCLIRRKLPRDEPWRWRQMKPHFASTHCFGM